MDLDELKAKLIRLLQNAYVNGALCEFEVSEEIINNYIESKEDEIQSLTESQELSDEEIGSIISKISVNQANFEYIATSGSINGSLHVDLMDVIRQASKRSLTEPQDNPCIMTDVTTTELSDEEILGSINKYRLSEGFDTDIILTQRDFIKWYRDNKHTNK